jgi:serine/threonine protein kinase
MSESNIGPKIYDSFYIENEQSITNYTIMEKFDKDLFSVLVSTINTPKSINTTKEFIGMTIKLFNKQVYLLSVYCTDIKPENYVVKKNKVRMIDFGTFCNEGINSFFEGVVTNGEYNKQDLFYYLVLLQLYVLIMALLNYRNKADVLKYDSNNEIHQVLEPFFRDPNFLPHVQGQGQEQGQSRVTVMDYIVFNYNVFKEIRTINHYVYGICNIKTPAELLKVFPSRL